MPGARSVINKSPASSVPEVTRVFKRSGGVTKAEKDLVTQFVLDQPRDITPSQVNALAKVLRRSREAVRAMVEEARETFISGAAAYVQAHRTATMNALKDGDNETAAKASQWYLEHVSAEGVRIVDKVVSGPQGAKIMIGIKMGGLDTAPVTSVPGVVISHD